LTPVGAKTELLDNSKQVSKNMPDIITLSIFLMRQEEREL